MKIFLWYFLVSYCHARNNPQIVLSDVDLASENDITETRLIDNMANAYKADDNDSTLLLRYHESKLSRDTVRMAFANRKMGRYWKNISPGNSLEYMEKAYRLFEKMNAREDVFITGTYLVNICGNLQDYEKQLHYLRKMLQYSLDTNDKEKEFYVLYHLAENHMHQGKSELANEYISMAIKESHRQDNRSLGLALAIQADLAYMKGNYAHYMNISREMLAWAVDNKNRRIKIIAGNNIARCYMRQGDYLKANSIVKQNLSELEAQNDTEEIFDLYYKTVLLLADIDTAGGNYSRAMEIQRKIEQIMAQQNSSEHYQKNLQDILITEQERLETQLSDLVSIRHNKEIQMAEMNFIVVFLVLGIVIGIFIYIWVKSTFKRLNREREHLIDVRKHTEERKNRIYPEHKELDQERIILRRSHQHLEQSDRTKTELFKTISKDLQMPLDLLQQNLTRLMSTDMDESAFKKSISNLTGLVGDISLLLENLLQWSKFHSQGIHAKPQYTEITMLLDDAITQQKYGALEKHISLSNELQHRLYVYVDEEMIKCLVKTILQNTIKLSGTESAISIFGHKDDNDGWIQIKCTGKMPMKDLYLRLSETDDYGAEQSETGKALSLGWMLCRMLMKANKGRIKIDDISPEEFDIYLYFPLEEAKKE
ncbi:MAG: hypothetical protein LBH60_02025 [Prevotellaceae bacterium]|jgi:tetratricopeptide (TPR) repeat protein|nr:hypothetical protein [Prevotellaceae bacterium]